MAISLHDIFYLPLRGLHFSGDSPLPYPSHPALSSCRDLSASSALWLSVCTPEYSKRQILGLRALGVDGSRQDDKHEMDAAALEENNGFAKKTIPQKSKLSPPSVSVLETVSLFTSLT